ncbi:TPA: hydroxymethylglutaryl-CoA reductase (NADPH) [Candidatus Woesearchaeota archaeon]|nr:Hydroxymethylglutaryl-CoA reductase [archaeon GW2011_AR15]MBS3103710.1 hydroxymethylglutaryl-CoA reductase (NADPH) [Candidatus Woesearchaeota archaeon]HIH41002.1 hydroxymethylglutaryl-CoA reductase (NADPH) [Candidatus Woesearchaeota archaeon]
MGTNSGSAKKLHEMAEEERRAFLEKKLGVNLENIKKSILNEKQADANIENLIGSAQLPMGIAGPVKVSGEHAKGEFYIPLATTEGALVASVSRGCSVISKSGGAEAVIIKNEQTRSILFKAKSVKEAKKFTEWAEENFEKLKKAGEEGERFLRIIGIDSYVVGLNVWLRIKADTSDAMGMNMVTIAGKKIADYVSKNYEIEFVSESGNMCVDKKPGAMNLIESRGKRVIASVSIPEEVIESVLKTTSDNLADMNYRKNLLGSAASGSLGYNAHFANIIAAMFIATGQDAAHVVDGSLGFTTVEKNEGGVNFSVTLSSLQVGTVGGGTGLKTQKEALSIMGVAGPGNPPGANSKKLAEITAAAVLAGEISLLGALCSKELSSSHQKLNR